MCGNYNVAINRLALESVEAWQERGIEVTLVTRGSKGEAYLRKRNEAPISTTRHGRVPASPTSSWTLFDIAAQAFEIGEADEVWCTYTRFYSPVRREPRLVRMLPIKPQGALAEEGPISPAATERWSYEPRSAPSSSSSFAPSRACNSRTCSSSPSRASRAPG